MAVSRFMEEYYGRVGGGGVDRQQDGDHGMRSVHQLFPTAAAMRDAAWRNAEQFVWRQGAMVESSASLRRKRIGRLTRTRGPRNRGWVERAAQLWSACLTGALQVVHGESFIFGNSQYTDDPEEQRGGHAAFPYTDNPVVSLSARAAEEKTAAHATDTSMTSTTTTTTSSSNNNNNNNNNNTGHNHNHNHNHSHNFNDQDNDDNDDSDDDDNPQLSVAASQHVVSFRCIAVLVADAFSIAGFVTVPYVPMFVLSVSVTVIFFLAVAYCWWRFPTIIRTRYSGWPVNFVLGVRCNCGPARHLRNVPTLTMVTTAVIKLSLAMAINAFPRSQATYANDCCGTVHCGVAVPYCLLRSLWQYIVFLHGFVALTANSDLTSAAQMSLFLNSRLVASISPYCARLVRRAETAFASIPALKDANPVIYAGMAALCIGFGCGFFIQALDVEFDLTGKELGVRAIVATLGYGIMSALWLFIVARVSFSLWAAYYGCVARLQALTDELVDKLELGSRPRHTSASDNAGTKHGCAAPEDHRNCSPGRKEFKRAASRRGSAEDNQVMMTVDELHAWWRVRRYYTETVFPVVYRLGNFGNGVLLLLFLLVSINLGLDLPEASTNLGEYLERGWQAVVITITSGLGLALTLRGAIRITAEQSIQLQILRDHKVDLALFTSAAVDPAVAASAPPSSPRSSATVFRRRSRRRPSKHQPFIHAGERGHRQEADPRMSAKKTRMVASRIEAIDELLDHMEQFDPTPRVLGFPINDVLLNTLYGYIFSGVSLAAAYFLNSSDVLFNAAGT